MGFFARRLTLFVFLVTLCRTAPIQAQTTYAADRFADSVGVNVHLHYENTVYRDNFPLIQTRLAELKVRHIRDGLIDSTWMPYYARHNALGRMGIKGAYIVLHDQSAALHQQYPSRMADSFYAYEGPNELNHWNDPIWITWNRNSLAQLRSMRNLPGLAAFPVYGASVDKEIAYTQLGDVGHLIDYGNMHNYFSSRHPGTWGWGSNGYGSIDWNLTRVQRHSGGKPTITTETGYRNDIAHQDHVTPAVAGRYMPRLLLEQFRKGVYRTYIYELADFSRSAYGILNSDGSPKPAFVAVKELLSLMVDPGPAVTITPLQYSVAGGTADIRHMPFQKRDGSYFLAIWQEVSSFEPVAKTPVVVPPQTVTITVHDPMARPVQTHRWQDNGSVARSSIPNAPTSLALTVTDLLTIVEFRPVVSLPTSPTNLRILQ